MAILLVDDERPLLELLRRYLERAGYEVDVSETGMGALEKCRAAPSAYSVAILDLKLPDIRGEELLPKLLEASPTLQVVVASGTPYSPQGLPAAMRPRVRALLKPFLPKELLEAVRQMGGLGRGASVE
ncbi:MAG: response regulator [Bryobacteraceae bacterium]|jgi:DNA-binding response OmpR family regulator